MGRLYPEMSISEVKVLLYMIDSTITSFSYKSVNDPFNTDDYKKLYQVIESVQKVSRCRWSKEFY